MRLLAKILNEETKQVNVADLRQKEHFEKIGFSEQEVEQAYDGSWYLKGYAPEKPTEQKEAEVRSVRNQYLEQTDKYMIADYPITDDERELYKKYRVYLRTYPECQDWYKANPKTYDEWKSLQTTNNNEGSFE